MSRPRSNGAQASVLSTSPRPTPPPGTTAPAPSLGDSVPVGTLMLSGIIRTEKGYCVAQLEIPAEMWNELPGKKHLGVSQRYPEHIARLHKEVVMKMANATQFQRVKR